MSKVFALIDCNSFYCSCERLFRPELKNSPIVVLSNNDGCAVSRTPEAKALGIKMGEPEFKIRNDAVKSKAVMFSSNYTLYGDMSQRVQDVVREFSDDVEVYSIDEMFLRLDNVLKEDLVDFCKHMKDTVYQWVGIPTSIGLGSTKTLAKVANHIAKKHPELKGVCSLVDERTRDGMLKKVSVSDVWGIGRASSAKLKKLGVNTAYDLKCLPAKQARQYGTVVAEKMIHELNGISCIPLEEVAPQRKGTACTRSFGRPVTDYNELVQAVSSYASRGAEKLRKHELVAGSVTVFIHTNKYRDTKQYYNRASSLLEPMTNDTRQIIETSLMLLKQTFLEGIEYGKAGIMLNDLRHVSERPYNLLFDDKPHSQTLMTLLDGINQQHGSNTLQFAGCGVNKRWKLRSNYQSPCYTTRLSDVVQVK